MRWRKAVTAGDRETNRYALFIACVVGLYLYLCYVYSDCPTITPSCSYPYANSDCE